MLCATISLLYFAFEKMVEDEICLQRIWVLRGMWTYATPKALMIAANFDIPTHINHRRAHTLSRLRCRTVLDNAISIIYYHMDEWYAMWWNERRLNRNMARLMWNVNELWCHNLPSALTWFGFAKRMRDGDGEREKERKGMERENVEKLRGPHNSNVLTSICSYEKFELHLARTLQFDDKCNARCELNHITRYCECTFFSPAKINTN